MKAKINKLIYPLCAILLICNIYQSVNIEKVAKGYEGIIDRMETRTEDLNNENMKLKRQLSICVE